MGITVGIDTGGTFTDLVAVDDRVGALARGQGALEPGQPRRGDRRLARAPRASTRPTSSFVVVGTTIGINAVLTRRGARVVYLTTEGFQDVPHIQRINRKHHYDFHWRKPTPLVHRPDCLGVAGAHGRGRPRARPDRPRGARRRRSRRSSATATSRRRSRSASSSRTSTPSTSWPRASCSRSASRSSPVSLSHEVAPIWREYERGTTVTVDAYLKPLFERYVDGVSDGARGQGHRRALGAAEVERRSCARRRGARAPGAPPALGHRGRRDRRRLCGARRRDARRRSRSTWAARAATSA